MASLETLTCELVLEEGEPVVFGIFLERDRKTELMELYFSEEDARQALAEFQLCWEEEQPDWLFSAQSVEVLGCFSRERMLANYAIK